MLLGLHSRHVISSFSFLSFFLFYESAFHYESLDQPGI